jgi:antirestriction protein ArdC
MSAALREKITQQIVSALEKGGLPPWKRPWATHPNGSGLPVNAVSKKRYSGVNILLAQLHQMRHGLRSKFYATSNQWQAMNCRVKARPKDVQPGQWGCNIIYCAPVKKVERSDKGDEKTKEFLLLKNYTIFSACQVEGDAAVRFQVDDHAVSPGFIDYAPAERAVAAAADIRFGGSKAFYRRPAASGDGDFIQMPHKHQFEGEKENYSTLLHELAGHWTDHRLGWSGSYAEGELRAEMASAFALAELGVPQSDDLTNHQSYLASWLQAMRDDPKYLFRASTEASKAVEFFLSLGRQPEEAPETDEALVA